MPKVSENQDQMIIEAAKNLADLGFATFDECMEASKMFNGNVEQACEYLLSKYA